MTVELLYVDLHLANGARFAVNVERIVCIAENAETKHAWVTLEGAADETELAETVDEVLGKFRSLTLSLAPPVR